MFDGLGSMMKLLGNKDKIAQEAAKLQDTIAQIVGEGTVPGAVTVRVSGKMEVLHMAFTAQALEAGPERLAEAVTAATNQALASARTQMAAETQKLAQSLGLPPSLMANIPGLA